MESLYLRVLQSNPHEVIGVEMVTNDEIIVLATEKNHKIPILAGSLRLVIVIQMEVS